jgi:hypothetical protein
MKVTYGTSIATALTFLCFKVPVNYARNESGSVTEPVSRMKMHKPPMMQKAKAMMKDFFFPSLV